MTNDTTMKIFYQLILFLLFFIILFISIRLDKKKRLWVIIVTALVLYLLSELSGFLKEKWFPVKPSIVLSENGARAFRVSDQGQLETAILKPIVEIRSAQLIDSRNHPHFGSQSNPFLYKISFNFDIINGIENKQPLILKEVTAVFNINDGKSEVKQNFKFNAIINAKTSENISTDSDRPIFLGYTKEIKSCNLYIKCKFEKFADLESKEFDVSIE